MTHNAEKDRTPHTHGGTDAPECTPHGIPCRPAEKDTDILRDVTFRMAEDITRIKVVCTQEHPPKMASPTPDWPAGTETRHSDGTRCVLLNDGDYARVIPPGVTP